MRNNITLGSDPELAIIDESKGAYASALRVLGKDKMDPIVLLNGIKIYADNALMEASMPPANDIGGMMWTIRDAMVQMSEYLFEKDIAFRAVPQSTVEFKPQELRHKASWEVGCNPNSDAYTGLHNPTNKFVNGIRTGSFHIHIGHPKMSGMDDKIKAVKLLDIYLGCASVIFDRDPTSITRRKLYGRAGEFRPTPYGIEYRVLGNWSLNNPEVTRLCFDLVDYAMDAYDSGVYNDIFKDLDESDVRCAINEGNKGLSEVILYTTGVIDHAMFRRIKTHYDYLKIYNGWMNYNGK